MLNRLFATLLVSAVVFAGCSQPAEEAEPTETPEVEAEATEEAPAPAEEAPAEEEAAPAEEAEEPAMSLPEALAAHVELSDDFTITKVDTLNEEALQYHIELGTKLNVDRVQDFFVKQYTDKGWTEDMNMSQKGNTVTSYTSADGFLIFIEANKGGRGSEVTINTGKA